MLARLANCESVLAQQQERTQRALVDTGRVANQIKAIEQKLTTLTDQVGLLAGAT